MGTDNDWLALCDNIDDGAFDSALDEIARAVVSRRDVVSRRNARRIVRLLIPNQTMVRLTNGVKPRFYENMVGIIREVTGEAALVELTTRPQPGRGRPPAELQTKIRVAIINLEIVDPDTAVLLSSAKTKADIGDDEDYEDDDLEPEDDDDEDIEEDDDDDDDDDEDDEPPVKQPATKTKKKK